MTGLSLDTIPWNVLTHEQKRIRRLCLSVLDEMRWNRWSLNKVKLPKGITRKMFIDNVRSALHEVEGFWFALSEDRIQVEVHIVTEGRVKSLVIDCSVYLPEISRYYWELYMFYNYREHYIEKFIGMLAEQFKGKRIIDIHGNSYAFETEIKGLDNALEDVKQGKFGYVFRDWPYEWDTKRGGLCPDGKNNWRLRGGC